jgi:hypothetical protein
MPHLGALMLHQNLKSYLRYFRPHPERSFSRILPATCGEIEIPVSLTQSITSRFSVISRTFLMGTKHELKPTLGYFAESGGAGAESAAAISGVRNCFTDSGSSLACASSWLTCHNWVSVSTVLKAGIPVSRMPLAAFQ